MGIQDMWLFGPRPDGHFDERGSLAPFGSPIDIWYFRLVLLLYRIGQHLTLIEAAQLEFVHEGHVGSLMCCNHAGT